jgi:Icc protein
MLDTLVPGAGHGELSAEQLRFLDRSLAAAPGKPTIIGMHHPPMITGIAHLDRINLHNTPAFAEVIARHRQVDRIVCGHHHRPIIGRLAHAIVSISPSVVHQAQMSLDPDDPGAIVLEPPAFQLHCWTGSDGVASHTVYVEDYPGPYPFLQAPD